MRELENSMVREGYDPEELTAEKRELINDYKIGFVYQDEWNAMLRRRLEELNGNTEKAGR